MKFPILIPLKSNLTAPECPKIGQLKSLATYAYYVQSRIDSIANLFRRCRNAITKSKP